MIRPVLVVEDDKKIARVVELYLEQAGYRVVRAETGREALDLAAKENSAGSPRRSIEWRRISRPSRN